MNAIIHPHKQPIKLFNPKDLCNRDGEGEVLFMEGRYIDIANTKHKDPHTLYFGKSKSSNLLSGLFLGDIELTSKVRDVSLVSVNGVITLGVKYINEDGKLASVKTKLVSGNDLTALNTLISKLNTSVSKVEKKLNVIDVSLNDIVNHLALLDSSISKITAGVVNEASVKKELPSYENEFNTIYTVLNNDIENTSSDKIKVSDMSLKDMIYDASSNTIQANILPDTVKSVDEENKIITLEDNTTVNDTNNIGSSIKKVISLDMNAYDQHMLKVIENELTKTTDSSSDSSSGSGSSSESEGEEYSGGEYISPLAGAIQKVIVNNSSTNVIINTIKETINVDSSLNDRVKTLEEILTWESAYTD